MYVSGRTWARPRHVGLVEVGLAVFAHKLAVRAVQRGSVRADLLNLFRTAMLVWLYDDTADLVRLQTFRIARNDVAAQPGSERRAELGRRPGAGLLEERRDGGGVWEDVACGCHKDGGLL